MTDDRTTHLRHVGRLLWPPPLEMTLGRPARGSRTGGLHREYLLLPNARAPRLLVPHGRRQAAAAALRGYGMGRNRAACWRAKVLAAGLASGVVPLVMRDRVRLCVATGRPAPVSAIESYLGEVLRSEVLLSMYLGAPRANRKPVLQILNPAGRTVAYAKVGIDPLTCQLVRAEAAALRRLATAGLKRTTPPQVLHDGPWNGLELLVQSPLPVDGRRWRPDIRRVLESQAEVAAIGRSTGERLAGSTYWASLLGRIQALPPSPAAGKLALSTARLAHELGNVPLDVGAWHGDWTPWNTAQVGDRLLVWDWERFGTAVPVGFDTLHWHLQSDLVERLADPLESARRCVSEAGQRLAPLGVTQGQARAAAISYLIELTTRYLGDRQSEVGARLGDVDTWLLPAIASALGSGQDPEARAP